MHVYAPRGPGRGPSPLLPSVGGGSWELGQEPFPGLEGGLGNQALLPNGLANGLVGRGWQKASDGSQPFALTIPRRATVEKVRSKVNI